MLELHSHIHSREIVCSEASKTFKVAKLAAFIKLDTCKYPRYVWAWEEYEMKEKYLEFLFNYGKLEGNLQI